MFQYKEIGDNPAGKFVFRGGVAFILLLPLILLVLVAYALRDMGGGGEYNVISSTYSPDGKYVVIVYSGSGGGAAGWTFFRATVNSADEPFDPENDKYILDIKGGSEIQPVWEGSNNLVITYTYKPGKTNTYFRISKETISRHTGVKIRYVEKVEPE